MPVRCSLFSLFPNPDIHDTIIGIIVCWEKISVVCMLAWCMCTVFLSFFSNFGLFRLEIIRLVPDFVACTTRNVFSSFLVPCAGHYLLWKGRYRNRQILFPVSAKYLTVSTRTISQIVVLHNDIFFFVITGQGKVTDVINLCACSYCYCYMPCCPLHLYPELTGF